MMKNTVILLFLTSLLCGCSGRLPAPVSATVVRDSTFTGRGNIDETLLTADVVFPESVEIKSLSVDLDYYPADISAIRVSIDGEQKGYAKIRKGRKSYSIRCMTPVIDTARIRVSADISNTATEGDHLMADIMCIRTDKGDFLPDSPAKSFREILLARKCLFMPGDFGSRNYRIPAIYTLDDGSLLTMTDRRKYNMLDLPEDIDVVSRSSHDGGLTWSDPLMVAEGTGYGKGFGDAAIVQAADGTVVCAFSGGAGLWNSSPDNPQTNWICLSRDNGKTWGDPVSVTSMQWGPDAVNPECRGYRSAFFASGRGLLLTKGEHAGRIMFATAIADKNMRFHNYAFWSDDNGMTWNLSSEAFNGGDEAKLVELNDGTIIMSVRQNGERGWNVSKDGGQTWGTQGWWPDICTNACDGDIILYGNSLLLQSVPNSMRRENVTIFISEDGGRTWPEHKSICPYESVYSALTILPDGTIGAYIEENPGGGDIEMWYMNFSIEWLRNNINK